ncbi:Cytidine deaminase-like protein [Tylopilus felleus]
MFIAIVGTRGAGKSTVEDYLVSKGFTSVHLAREDLVEIATPTRSHRSDAHLSGTLGLSRLMTDTSERQSFLNMNSPVSSTFPHRSQPVLFASPEKLLDHVTRNWRKNFVTVNLTCTPLVSLFAKRPFFLLVNVDAPLLQRYRRLQGPDSLSLEEFVREDDECVFGTDVYSTDSDQKSLSGLRGLNHLVKLNIINTFQSLSELHFHLDFLDLINAERLRPQWDTYFMTLAELASQRSNCMKRRVGAILVRDNRIVATGYNGTPRGVTNCHDGGCTHCNQTSNANDFDCLCLHAEENALLEAGRDRVGVNAILYCNTCPCLKCTIKIIQSGVKRVIYHLSYKVDEASARLFQEAGVEIRRHVPPATA